MNLIKACKWKLKLIILKINITMFVSLKLFTIKCKRWEQIKWKIKAPDTTCNI
jgi:hypothetical protein